MNEHTVPTEQPDTAQAMLNQASEITPSPGSGEQHGFQVWYMLNSLAITPDRCVKWGDVKRKVLSKKAREMLGLTEENAKQVLDELQQAGAVRTSEKRGTVVYELTEAGAQRLQDMAPHEAFAASAAAATPVSDETLRYQHACLLLNLLETDNQGLTKSEANARLGRLIQRDIGLNPVVANIRRQQLARQGYIEIDKSGRQETYRLTADGRDYLAALEQYPETEFRLRGSAINALITAAKESPGREREPRPETVEESPALTAQEVS